MFKLRIVDGAAAGEYFTGFCISGGGNQAIRSNPDVNVAAVFDRPHTVSNILALIDVFEIVAVPELTAETTEEQCQVLASDIVQEMFQFPRDKMADVIRMAFRESADAPIFPRPVNKPHKPGFMSVWEWMAIALNANGITAEDPPQKAKPRPGLLRRLIRRVMFWR